MDNQIFYISSRGSSASTWLAKALSRHPRIVAFQSSRTLPPCPPGQVPDMSPDEYMQGLLVCSNATLGEKVFGSMHGYHGAYARQACLNNGGLFSYMTRHPVSRLSSYFIYMADRHYTESGNNVPNETILDRLLNITDQNEFKALLKIFTFGCHEFFFFEQDAFFASGPEWGIKMEDMVSNPLYFKKEIWPKIAPHIDITDEYIESIYGIGRIGVHRKKPTPWQEAWEKWPLEFKDIFIHYFKKYKISEVCKAFNYETDLIPK